MSAISESSYQTKAQADLSLPVRISHKIPFTRGALEAQWVKRWSTDQAVPGSSTA